MRKPGFDKEISALLESDKELTVSDFFEACPGAPAGTVYSKIRSLMQRGVLSQTGHGRYLAVHKPKFEVPVTDWMVEVNEYLTDQCEGVNHCVYERSGYLCVEAARSDLPQVMACLKRHSPKVVLQKDANAFPSVLEGYIIVGALVSDAPVREESGISIPSLEKTLVDSLANKREDGKSRQFAFQKAMEVYPVNVNRMKRYAARRGVKEELAASLTSLDTTRIEMFSTVQKYLASIPVLRAWVFGSFARGEETPASDLDLLVDYDKSNKLSLLNIIRFKLDLEKIISREVDLIENGYLRPFAVPSAERDKYLIYEK